MPRKPPLHTCVIIGAGAAGVGLGVALTHVGIKNFVILERHKVGSSFRRWPKEMRLITPSFPTNSIGMLDLNAVAIGTSPGWSLKCEHPTGEQFANYLAGVADYFKLPIETEVDVESVTPLDDGGFTIQTTAGVRHAKNVVWAAGEFQYPRQRPFPGAELCLHSSQIESYSKLPGSEYLVIGGYESGIDAAVHLASCGKRARVLDRNACWKSDESDPSRVLSPFTWERLYAAQQQKRVELINEVDVQRVERTRNAYVVRDQHDRTFRSATPPILATGFDNSLRLVHPLFEYRDDGYPLLDETDQSTITPGLFLAGPMVRHEHHVFCFIYKFRQRFAVIARAIGQRLDLDTSALETYRSWGMFLDDLSCCGQECVC